MVFAAKHGLEAHGTTAKMAVPRGARATTGKPHGSLAGMTCHEGPEGVAVAATAKQVRAKAPRAPCGDGPATYGQDAHATTERLLTHALRARMPLRADWIWVWLYEKGEYR